MLCPDNSFDPILARRPGAEPECHESFLGRYATIGNYWRVLEATFVAHVVRPFSTRRPNEIVAAPKVYGFDTGFVCYYRGWYELRQDDLGVMWEHFVLNELMARTQSLDVAYWRDKCGHEVDFILTHRRKEPLALECPWSADSFDPTSLRAFRQQHPAGDNVVVAQDVERAFSRSLGELRVRFENLDDFADSLKEECGK